MHVFVLFFLPDKFCIHEVTQCIHSTW